MYHPQPTQVAPLDVGTHTTLDCAVPLRCTQVAPPLDEVDGAARVLDPVFMHLNDMLWLQRGKLWKDYRVVSW